MFLFSLIRRGSELLRTDSGLAGSTSCCCEPECYVCSFECAVTATLTLTGFQRIVCPHYAGGIPFTEEDRTYYWDNLNGPYLTSNISKATTGIPCVHSPSAGATYTLGTLGSDVDRGTLVMERETTILGSVETEQLYIYQMDVAAACVAPFSGFLGGICMQPYFLFVGEQGAGYVKVYQQRFLNGVYSTFPSASTTYCVYCKAPQSACYSAADLHDNIAPSRACGLPMTALSGNNFGGNTELTSNCVSGTVPGLTNGTATLTFNGS